MKSKEIVLNISRHFAILAMIGLVAILPSTIISTGLPHEIQVQAASSSSVVKVKFTAVVTNVDNGQVFKNHFKQNDIISGTYSYDLAVRDLSETDLRNGLYDASGSAAFKFTLLVDGMSFQSATPHGNVVTVNHDPGQQPNSNDQFAMLSLSNTPLDNIPINQITMSFVDPTGRAITSDAALPLAPNLANWQTRNIAFNGPDGAFAAASINSVEQVCTCSG